MVVESACERGRHERDAGGSRAREGEGRRRSRGNLVGRSSRPRDKSRAKIAIAWCFTSEMDCEEASLRFREGVGAEITSLAWSADSACLSVAVRYGGEDGDRAVQIWTRSNMHWYMKHETRYDASGEARAEWDAKRGDVLRTYTEKGTVERFDLFWETTTSDRGTCAVIDGDVVMLTPMFRTPMPPPLCAAKAVFSAASSRGVSTVVRRSRRTRRRAVLDGLDRIGRVRTRHRLGARGG